MVISRICRRGEAVHVTKPYKLTGSICGPETKTMSMFGPKSADRRLSSRTVRDESAEQRHFWLADKSTNCSFRPQIERGQFVRLGHVDSLGHARQYSRMTMSTVPDCRSRRSPCA